MPALPVSLSKWLSTPRSQDTSVNTASETARSTSPTCQTDATSMNSKDATLPPSIASNSKAGSALTLSPARILFAHIGAALTLFLATTDSTVVSTALPSIVKTYSASQAQYTWVGVSYMLTQTACQPLYGKLSDLAGRKFVLFSSIAIFAFGSLLCGVAQSITWLIIARGLSGIGGGGIVSCVWIITAEIVAEEKRAKWSQALSVTWSCSAVAGPLLGGLFSGSESRGVSWRWAFYINLPICVIAMIVLTLSLRGIEIGFSQSASWRGLLAKFDFAGLILFVAGTCCIVIGFNFAASSGWNSPSTLSLIIGGIALLCCAVVYESKTRRDALFPLASFKNLNVGIVLCINFLHNFAFTSATFYLALSYQSLNSIPVLNASLMLLPYSLGSSLASMPAAWFLNHWQTNKKDVSGQRIIIASGLVVATLGFGLLQLLHHRLNMIAQAVIPLVAGIGLGMLFHAPYQVFVCSLPPQDLAAATSAFFLVRFTGATVGLALSGAIFSRFAGAAAASMNDNSPAMIHAIAQALRYIWILCTPCLGIALLLSLFLRNVKCATQSESGCSPDEKTAANVTADVIVSGSLA
ncbi:MFS general substrate transporter [Peniophora sp. CONT]|nr:MFS general substrate transporter [Peniophora sp. CONT]